MTWITVIVHWNPLFDNKKSEMFSHILSVLKQYSGHDFFAIPPWKNQMIV